MVRTDPTPKSYLFHRFFSLASSFSRKPTASEEDLHATTPGTPRSSHDSHAEDEGAPSEARSSGATIVSHDWAPNWGKKAKEVVEVVKAEEAEQVETKVEADEQAETKASVTV